MAIVLGIDPSLRNTGLAALELGATAREDRIVELQVVSTEKRQSALVGKDDARRVGLIAQGLDGMITKHQPCALVFEVPGGAQDARAARALALATATVVTVAKLRGLPLVHVQPLEVKLAMTGRKRAEKDEIILAVEQRFARFEWPDDQDLWEHAADAVGAVVAAYGSRTIELARSFRGGGSWQAVEDVDLEAAERVRSDR